MKRLLPLLLLTTGCMILPPEPEPPEPPPVIVLPPPVDVPPAAPGPRVDQLWLVRVDRGLVNLAAPTEALLERYTRGLAQAGLTPGAVVVASLYDGRLLWAGEGPQLVASVKLSEALAHHGARSEGGLPTACSTRALGELGLALSDAELRYPPELAPGLSPSRPLSQLGAGLLVGLVDAGDPPRTAADPTCERAGESVAQWFGGHDPVQWVVRRDGRRMARASTRFVLVGTSEALDTNAYRRACLTQPTFPQAATDFLTAASHPFYGPVAQGLGALAVRLDLCEALGGAAPPAAFLPAWAEALRAQP